MASGLRALRKILVGQETTKGTAVTPTAFLVGTLGMRDQLELFMPDEYETGRLASYERSQIIAREATLPFEADANYEQLAYLLEMAVKQTEVGGVPAVTDSRYVNTTTNVTTWTYTPNYTESNDPLSLTVQYGDDIQQFESAFVSCRNIEFSGQVGDIVKTSADLFGRTVTKIASFGATVEPPDRESIKMGTSELYIDPTWAAVGTTAKTATLVDFSYKFNTGFSPMKYADNRLDFSDLAEAKRHVELDMTVGFNDSAVELFDAYNDQSQVVVELRFTGSEVSANNNKSFKLQVGGNVTEFMELSEREGQDIVKVKLMSIFDDTGDRDMSIILENGEDDLA